VLVKDVYIIGACNPPTDSGRTPLNNRYLRQTYLLFCSYPERDSLITIYGKFMKVILSNTNVMIKDKESVSERLTELMVDFYIKCEHEFTVEKAPH